MGACSPRRFPVRSFHSRLPHHRPPSTATANLRSRVHARPIRREAPTRGPPVETSPPMRSVRARAGAIAEVGGAGFERFAAVFERGGREPMGGSEGWPGDEQAVGWREGGGCWTNRSDVTAVS